MAETGGITVYQCSFCGYPLLTEDEVKVAKLWDDGFRFPSGNFIEERLVCKDEFDCARRQRDFKPGLSKEEPEFSQGPNFKNPGKRARRICSLDTFGWNEDGSSYVIRGDGCTCEESE